MRQLALIILLACPVAAAQTAQGNPKNAPGKTNWSDWEPFMGHWTGTGGGEPGQGHGSFTFETELQGAVMVRRNSADYPATKNKPAYIHEDLMVIYPAAGGKGTRADYWDNEGHVIHYEVNVAKDKLVFLSDRTDPGPRFRLTYIKTGGYQLKLTFEIAPPNDQNDFQPYIEASAVRVIAK